MIENETPLMAQIVFLPLFSFFVLISLVFIVKPEIGINLSVKYWKWSLKLYGFEAEIKPTSRARTICRVWNVCMFLIFITGLVQFLKQ